MKWDKIKNYVFLFFAAISFYACGTNENTKVEKAVKGFFEGMYDRDFSKARAHATVESEEIINMLQSFAQDTDPAPDEKPNIAISNIEVNDTLAFADVHASDQPNTVRLSLKKRENKWLVAFDPRSLAIMLGQDPDTVEEDMMAPPDDSLNLQIEKSTIPLELPTDSIL